MSLATKCPHCHTTFKVALDQLKLQAGLVRCGICQHVFSGTEHLIASNNANTSDLVDDSIPHISLENITPDDKFTDINIDLPVSLSNIAFDETPLNFEQETSANSTNASAKKTSVSESGLNSIEFNTTIPTGKFLFTPLTFSDEVPADSLESVGNTVDSSEIEKAEEIEEEQNIDDLEQLSFIRQAKTKKRLFWFFFPGTILLFILLIGQAAYQFRNLIAAAYPPSKEILITLCKYAQCQVQLPAQLGKLSYEADELHSLPRENTFEFSLLMHNHSSLTQAWPYIELTLKNTQKQSVLKHVFAPADYLPNTQAIEKGFPANQEQAVRLYFELNQLTASDYEVTIFYP